MPVKTGTITFTWGDGDYAFRLGIGELQEIQRKTGAGPLELYRRLSAGNWRVEDLREIIFNGLIGAGMAPKDAVPLRKRYIDERPLMESVEPATKILSSALIGPPDDAPKKAAAEETEATSLSAASTKTAPSSASGPETSTT